MIPGMKRLIAERTATLVQQAAVADPAGGPMLGRMVAQIQGGGLVQAARDATEWARLVVLAIRKSNDYDAAVHGRSDDEIADWVLSEAGAKRLKVRR